MAGSMFLLLAASSVGEPGGASLATMLRTMPFLHRGEPVRPSSRFEWVPQSFQCYLESVNVSKPNWSWTVGGCAEHEDAFPYLYERAADSESCSAAHVEPASDLPGYDFAGGPTAVTSEGECASQCCATAGCFSWSFHPAHIKCGTDPCCFMKTGWPRAVPDPDGAAVSGRISRTKTPAIGMRSAVPLGGYGAPGFELRADGSLAEWTLDNRSPGGSGKMNQIGDAILAVRLGKGKKPFALRTAPPAGVLGVDGGLRYRGLAPAAALEVESSELGASSATLYAYSALQPYDMDAASAPAITFSLVVRNPTDAPVKAELLFNLPINIEQEQRRPMSDWFFTLSHAAADSPAACLALCHADAKCQAWQLDRGNCSLSSSVALGAWAAGNYSGVKGTWNMSVVGGETCLQLTRDLPADPSGGTLAVCADDRVFTGTDVRDIMAQLGAGPADGAAVDAAVDPRGVYGAAVSSAQIPARGTAALNVTLTWRLPNRDYVPAPGNDVGTVVGNGYADVYSSAIDPKLVGAPRAALPKILQMQRVFANSSLPGWLSDTILNSIGHARSAWWDKDGRFFQWEAFDCIDHDSVHNDGERHGLYINFWPQVTESKLRSWATIQETKGPDLGMIQEQFAGACMTAADPSGYLRPVTRRMGDVSSMYVVYLQEVWQWHNNSGLLTELWPTARRALQWHLRQANASGLPMRLCNTYDVDHPETRDVDSYNAMFHLLAMRSGAILAAELGDVAFAATLHTAYLRGQQAIDELLWDEPGKFYKFFNSSLSSERQLMVDAMYPQVLANNLGLGPLLAHPERVAQHLDAEQLYGTSAYGLKEIINVSAFGGMGSRSVGDSPATAMANCTAPKSWLTGRSSTGGDLTHKNGSDAASCQQACCENPQCQAWVLTNRTSLGNPCVDGVPCCCLKGPGALAPREDPFALAIGFKSSWFPTLPETIRYPDSSEWQQGPPDWASLHIAMGSRSVPEALAVPQKSLGVWRDVLHDMWNVASLAAGGLPSLTSHYGTYMTCWWIPIAMSGQVLHQPRATLQFSPKLQPPYALPVYFPGLLGQLRAANASSPVLLEVVMVEAPVWLRVGLAAAAADGKVEWSDLTELRAGVILPLPHARNGNE